VRWLPSTYQDLTFCTEYDDFRTVWELRSRTSNFQRKIMSYINRPGLAARFVCRDPHLCVGVLSCISSFLTSPFLSLFSLVQREKSYLLDYWCLNHCRPYAIILKSHIIDSIIKGQIHMWVTVGSERKKGIKVRNTGTYHTSCWCQLNTRASFSLLRLQKQEPLTDSAQTT
jgi:hypothetical protein